MGVSALRAPAEDEPVFLSPADVCKLVPGVTEDILYNRRKKRLDPPFSKPTGASGNVVIYDRADVIAWVASSRVQTRSDAA